MHFACVLDIPCSTLPSHSSKEMVPLASVSNLSKNAFMASSSTASKRHGPKSPRVAGIQPFSLNGTDIDNLTNIWPLQGMEEVLHRLRGGSFLTSEVYFGNTSMSELLKSTLPWLTRVTLWARKKTTFERFISYHLYLPLLILDFQSVAAPIHKDVPGTSFEASWKELPQPPARFGGWMQRSNL